MPTLEHFFNWFKSRRTYVLFVNGEKQGDYSMGDMTQIDLPEGKNTLRLRLSDLPLF